MTDLATLKEVEEYSAEVKGWALVDLYNAARTVGGKRLRIVIYELEKRGATELLAKLAVIRLGHAVDVPEVRS